MCILSTTLGDCGGGDLAGGDVCVVYFVILIAGVAVEAEKVDPFGEDSKSFVELVRKRVLFVILLIPPMSYLVLGQTRCLS